MLREMIGVNSREHLAFYSLASLSSFSISIPQFQAVDNALELGIRPQGTTWTPAPEYGSTSGLVLDFAIGILIFQLVLAVLTVGVSVAASSRRGWKWQYSLTSVLVSSYLAYHIGGKFLNALGWIELLEMSGVNISGVYGNLFWFGLMATICYLLSILFLRRSYRKLAAHSVTLNSLNARDSELAL